MTERALIRRELVRQTALLFFVFALLFALLGAGVYSMVSSNIYRNADENLQAIGMESDYITLDAAGSGSAIVDDVVVEEPDGAAPSDATAIDDLSLTLQQSIVDADPQFITLIRNEQGDLLETVGLYAPILPSCAISPSTRTTSNASTRLPRGVTSTAASRMRQTTKARPRIFRRW